MRGFRLEYQSSPAFVVVVHTSFLVFGMLSLSPFFKNWDKLGQGYTKLNSTPAKVGNLQELSPLFAAGTESTEEMTDITEEAIDTIQESDRRAIIYRKPLEPPPPGREWGTRRVPGWRSGSR